MTDHVTTTSNQTSSCVTSTSSDHVTATTSRMGSSASNPPLVAEISDEGRDECVGQGSSGEISTTPAQALGVLSSVSVLGEEL